MCVVERYITHIYKNTECCTTVLVWQMYIAGKSATYVGLHVSYPKCIETKECSFADGLL
jgi:hypothetical protein